MAYFHGTVRSKILGMDTGLTVVLPFDRAPIAEKECPVVYLLHGHGENSSVWTRMTSVERYANDYGVALIMPEVQRSFYTDMDKGLNYFTYVTEELPNLCQQLFRVSSKREERFVAGLSMGGYGAVKLGLRCPHLFSACAGFSGCLDLNDLKKMLTDGSEELANEAKAIFGEELSIRPEDDLFFLAQKAASLPREERPRVMITCGTEDFLYEQNVHFKDWMQKLDYDLDYREWHGTHSWEFWDLSIQYALEFFFPGRKNAYKK